MSKFSTPRPTKVYQNWDFWYENIPSGNPFLNVRGFNQNKLETTFESKGPIP
jgi:hypothetical protein